MSHTNFGCLENFNVAYISHYFPTDQDFIKRYPRTIKDSMRQGPNSRKTKRLEVKDRKEREKEKKREEIKQLKALKRKEIMEKLDKLKKIAGSQDLGLNEEDLEEDFDPEKYDKRMKELFEVTKIHYFTNDSSICSLIIF